MTDGTPAGTSVVQTFTPGQTQSSSPTILGVLNNELYFSANDGVRRTRARAIHQNGRGNDDGHGLVAERPGQILSREK